MSQLRCRCFGRGQRSCAALCRHHTAVLPNAERSAPARRVMACCLVESCAPIAYVPSPGDDRPSPSISDKLWQSGKFCQPMPFTSSSSFLFVLFISILFVISKSVMFLIIDAHTCHRRSALYGFPYRHLHVRNHPSRDVGICCLLLLSPCKLGWNLAQSQTNTVSKSNNIKSFTSCRESHETVELEWQEFYLFPIGFEVLGVRLRFSFVHKLTASFPQ
ncbi:hypothetical protein V6N11_048679 [Hibiscus sabdariffa]|uniref:Uncharacterized protein n=1 Tax=Hibiscus sabdariffa TaxID=183260 RepID=A0ABR2PVZ0_9ROSI